MWQLVDRTSVAAWVAAVTSAAVLTAGLVTGGAAPAIATPEPGTVEDDGTTLPVGATLRSDDYCATYANAFGSDHEVRPENSDANHSVPTDLRLRRWPDFWDSSANRLFVPRINGQFTGTTDRIIGWGACKWGIDTDVARAMAMEESSWRQAHVGDYVDDPAMCVGGHPAPCATSFGILQLKHTTRPGSWPNSQQHTAFNVDYSLAVLRGCFEGWVTYLHDGYTAGDLWGCVGWHYSGHWKNPTALAYVQRIQRHLDERSWTRI